MLRGWGWAGRGTCGAESVVPDLAWGPPLARSLTKCQIFNKVTLVTELSFQRRYHHIFTPVIIGCLVACFTDEESEAQRGKESCPKDTANEGQSQQDGI